MENRLEPIHFWIFTLSFISVMFCLSLVRVTSVAVGYNNHIAKQIEQKDARYKEMLGYLINFKQVRTQKIENTAFYKLLLYRTYIGLLEDGRVGFKEKYKLYKLQKRILPDLNKQVTKYNILKSKIDKLELGNPAEYIKFIKTQL